jgi:hypothetical protein
MAKNEGGTRYFLRATAQTLNLESSPKRKLALLFCGALVVMAAIALATETVGGSGGCNMVLSQPRFQCLNSAALRTGDYKYCMRIGPGTAESQCISSLADSTRNASMCSLLGREGSRYVQCIEAISYATANASVCGTLDPGNQSECAYMLAQNKDFSSISQCLMIQSRQSRSLCLSEYYYSAALNTANYTYCSMLVNSSNYTIMSALAKNQNLSSYLSFSYAFLNLSPRDYCYLSLSNMTGSRSCSGISNQTLKAYCKPASPSNSIAISENVTTLCSSSPYGLQGICTLALYTGEALASNNVTICNTMSNSSYRSYCIIQLASKYNQSTYCSYLPTENETNACIYQAGLQGGNYTK